jgi:hypothetical protein
MTEFMQILPCLCLNNNLSCCLLVIVMVRPINRLFPAHLIRVRQEAYSKTPISKSTVGRRLQKEDPGPEETELMVAATQEIADVRLLSWTKPHQLPAYLRG